MFRLMVVVLGVSMLLSACQYGSMDKYQGMTSRDDVENMGANDELTAQTENPRMMRNVGNTWGLKQDRELIKESIRRLPGVEVKRIILEASQVWVTVDVEGEDNLSKAELKDWEDTIRESVYQAVPRYNIHVNIK